MLLNCAVLALTVLSSSIVASSQITLERLKWPIPALSSEWSSVDHSQLASLWATSEGNGSDDSSQTTPQSGRSGLIGRSIRRGLEDQKELYSIPFKRQNLKWDVLVLATTGALIATDKHIERQLPVVHYNSYNLLSDAALGTLSGSLVTMWAYGIKTDRPHLKETGELELETLANTFLFYAPMQLIGARERPGEATNNGRFGHHHAFNTSFPGGHSMFTTAMATVLAHEYPKPWVEAAAYGAAAAVTAGRFIGRDHWASDLFVGNLLGYLIASHIFHAHCDPELSDACH